MIMKIIKRKAFVTILVLFCSLCLPGAVAHAGFGVSPASFISDLPEAKSFSTTVTNIGEDPINIVIIPAGLKVGPRGGVRSQESQKDLKAASRVFHPDPDKFALAPKASRKVTISVTLPENAKGGIYGTILVVSEPPKLKGSGVINVARIAIPVLFSLPGPSRKAGKVTKIDLLQKETGAPIEIKTMFKDTGNIHFRVTGKAFIESEAGKQLAVLLLGTHSVLPTGDDRLFSANWRPEKLSIGDYTVRAEMQIEDGPKVVKSKTFHVISPHKVLQLGGEIVDFSAPKVAQNKPIPFKLVFFNKSNVKLLPEGEIEIKDNKDNLMAAAAIVARERIAPKSSGELRATLEQGLSQGEYTATVKLAYGLLEYSEMRVVKVQTKLTVIEKEIIIAGKIAEFSVDSVKSGETIIPELFFENTGNTDFSVEGLIELKNSKGKTVGQIPVNRTLIPAEISKRIGGSWSGNLPPGLYKAVATLIYGEGKMVTKETSFLAK